MRLLIALVIAVSLLLPAQAEATAAAPTVTISRTGTGIVETGDTVSFSGTAPAAARGVRIKLERKARKKARWVVVGSDLISASGAWSASGKATGSGKNYWRASYTRNGTTTSSRTMSFKVYQWYFLTPYDRVDSSGFGEDSRTIGGTRYEYSGYGSCCTADWGEYNVSYRCVTFRANIGVDDNSQTGMRATFAVSADGASTPLGTRGLGPATLVEIDVTAILRVRMSISYPSTTYDGYGVFGNPRVLCAGEPA